MPTIKTTQEFTQKYPNAIQTGGGIFDTGTGLKYKLGTGTGYELVSGIELPDRETKPADTLSGLSMSIPSVSQADRDRIQREQEGVFSPLKQTIESRYGQKISQLEGYGREGKRALEGQFGTGRRLSTAASAFVNYVDEENKKKIAELEIQKEDAMANADYQMAQAINNRLDKELSNQRDSFNDMIKLIDLAKRQEEESLVSPEVIASKEGKIIDLKNKGITDIGEISQYLAEAGTPMPIKDISSIMDKLGSVSGLADIIQNSPELFSGIIPLAQRVDVIKELNKSGFDLSLLDKPKLDSGLLDIFVKNPNLIKSLDKIVPLNQRDDYLSELSKMGEDISKYGEPEPGGLKGAETPEQPYSPTTLNIIEGAQKLDNLTPTDKTKTIVELRELGFYSDVPPAWFKTNMEQSAQLSFTPEVLSKAWKESRLKVIGGGEDMNKSRESSGVRATINSLIAGDKIKNILKSREQIIDREFANSKILTRAEVEAIFDELVK